MSHSRKRSLGAWATPFYLELYTLRVAFNSAIAASQDLIAQAHVRADGIEQALASGRPKREVLQEYIGAVDGGEATIGLIAEAFLIALFHFWEKQLRTQMNELRYDHSRVIGYLKRNGLNPDCVAFEELKMLVETIKHSEGSSAKRLFELWPELFDRPAQGDFTPSYGALRVKLAHFDHYARVVAEGGPGEESALLVKKPEGLDFRTDPLGFVYSIA